jgi:EH domain-containing protein 1
MIGQYSTGKTSFIEYLLGRPFPGQRVGPEPTTDRFVAVMHGDEERVVPGNALSVQDGSPYRGLNRFGVAFLNKFEAACVPCPVLQNMTLVDTPGILSGEKQRLSRGYSFEEVAFWFANRSDLILLLFDAHKLDICDEFKTTILSLKGLDDKIRCVLNKADAIDRQKLMRCYGALMWSMGKIVLTPEVLRVYIGSFWDQPLVYEENAALFEAEENDLMSDFRGLPRNSAVRKINELVKRTRLAKVHAAIIGHLYSEMPALMGKEKKQADLIANLGNTFRKVQQTQNLPPGDFPDLRAMQEKLKEYNFSKFPKWKPKLVDELDAVLSSDIPTLMSHLPNLTEDPAAGSKEPENPFAAAASPNPFGGGGGGGGWALQQFKAEFDSIFQSLGPDGSGKIDGGKAMAPLQSTGAQGGDLASIWELSDIDKDGLLDADEFAVAMYLSRQAASGQPPPAALPEDVVPPSKK